MKALVTGGGGFLGSHIARELFRRGSDVKVVGRRDYPELPNGIEQFKADLCDPMSALMSCKGRDVVFHTAAMPSIWGKKEEFYAANVETTSNIIEACQKNGVKKLIYTSTPSVIFGDTDLENADETISYPEMYLSEYARTKAIAERLTMKANGYSGLLTVSIRPHLIWGPGDPHLVPRILQKARKGKLLQVGEGQNRVDIIFIDNAVEAHLKACEALDENSPLAGQTYFVSDGSPVVLWDWINEFLRQMGIPPIHKKISSVAAYCLGALMESVYRVLNLSGEPQMTRFLAKQLAGSHYFDITRARNDFGYRPVVTPEEGMRRLIEFLKSCPVD